MMDNDILIDQARNLYAALHVEQYVLSILDKRRYDRLDDLVTHAYCRYQRRLNRCVLCYQFRLTDCFRDFCDQHRKRPIPGRISAIVTGYLMPFRGFMSLKIAFITDAWHPQINGVR